MQSSKLPPGVKQCPACYNNLCKRHPRQDSGAALVQQRPSRPGETLDRLYNDLVAKNLVKAKMENAAARADAFEKAAATAAHAEAKRGGKEFAHDMESAVGIKPVASGDSDSGSSVSRSSSGPGRGRRAGRRSRSRSRSGSHSKRHKTHRSRSRSRHKHRRHKHRSSHHRSRSGRGSRSRSRDRPESGKVGTASREGERDRHTRDEGERDRHTRDEGERDRHTRDAIDRPSGRPAVGNGARPVRSETQREREEGEDT